MKNEEFGIFIFVGYKPQTTIYKDELPLDKEGYITTNEKMETTIKGVYAAGDIRVKPLRQLITAASDGAIAASVAIKYINGKNN